MDLAGIDGLYGSRATRRLRTVLLLSEPGYTGDWADYQGDDLVVMAAIGYVRGHQRARGGFRRADYLNAAILQLLVLLIRKSVMNCNISGYHFLEKMGGAVH